MPIAYSLVKDELNHLGGRSELMADPKTRKVIVLENPMLPTRVKQTIARTLFESLQIPSLSFASSPLCALLSIGRITGLVIDVGNLETCCLPVSLLMSSWKYCVLTNSARSIPHDRYTATCAHRLLRRGICADICAGF